MSQQQFRDNHAHLTAAAAVHIAMAIWGAMLILLLAVFVFTFSFTIAAMEMRGPADDSRTFVPLLVVSAVVVAASGFAHWYLFRLYWRDGLVQPKGYLLASIILYSGITLCVVLALIGNVIDGSLYPNILVAGMLVLLLMAVWPSGRAMRVRRARSEEDDDVELFHLPPDDEQRDR